MEQPSREFSSELDGTQLSWHGEVCWGNFDAMCAYNLQFKEQRLEMLRTVTTILRDADVPYWIEGGTLLGSYRSNSMIPHDNDVDVSILGDEDFQKATEAMRQHLPSKYSLKEGTSYAQKLEVNDDQSGVFYFQPDVICSNVLCDINLYRERPDGTLQQQYFKMSMEERRYEKDWVFPLDTVEFEGMSLSCPRQAKPYLEEMYGYIGEDFRYDPEAMKFVQWTWPERRQ